MTMPLSQLVYYAGGECLQRFGTPLWRRGLAHDTPPTFTRNTVGAFVDRAGKLRYAGANRLREEWLDLDADGVRETPSLLLENARTNLLLHSQDFGNAAWSNNNTTESTDAVAAPDGTTTADELTEDASAASTHYIAQGVTKAASSLEYLLSVYVLEKDARGIRLTVGDGAGNSGYVDWADISMGASAEGTAGSGFTVYSYGREDLANGWVRLWAGVGTNTATIVWSHIGLLSSGAVTYDGDGSSGMYIWGAQLEQTNEPSSYIATTTASAVRNSDYCESPWFYPVTTPITVYVKHIEGVPDTPASFGYANAGTRRHLIRMGEISGGTNTRHAIMKNPIAANYQAAIINKAIIERNSNVTLGHDYGSLIELCMQIRTTQALAGWSSTAQLHGRKDGGAISSGAVSTSLSYAAGEDFSDPVVLLGAAGDANHGAPNSHILAAKIALGEYTLDEMAEVFP